LRRKDFRPYLGCGLQRITIEYVEVEVERLE
jgi:hypothetical protein